MNNIQIQFIKKVGEYQPLVEQIYRDNLRVQFASLMPWVSEDKTKIMFCKNDLLIDKKETCNYIMKRIVDRCNDGESNITDRTEQIKFLNRVVGEVEMDLYAFAHHHFRECMIILQWLLDYNFHISIIFNKRNFINISIEEMGENLSKEILTTIQMLQQCGIDTSEAEGEIINILALDKQAIQKAESFLVKYMDKEAPIEDITYMDTFFNKDHIKELINIVRALYEGLIFRDFGLSGEIQCININEDLNLSFKTSRKKINITEIEQAIIDADDEIYSTEDTIFDEDVIKYFGYSKKELLFMLKNVSNINKTSSLGSLWFSKELFEANFGLHEEVENSEKILESLIFQDQYLVKSSFGHEKMLSRSYR